MMRERSIHLGKTDKPPPPPSLIVAGNLRGQPVSQVLETDDVRPLIGCLQRRRHQPAARAAGTESRTQGDGWMAGADGGEGRTDEDKVGRGGGVAEECQGREVGGHGEGLLMSRETVLCWRSLRG